MEIKRRKFQGVLNILSFNRHFYLLGFGFLALLLTCYLVFRWSDWMFWLILAVLIYGLLAPIVISAYVYDFSGYYNFKWLENCSVIDSNPKQILNINAGFDETSFIIKNLFPKAELKVFDFYNPKQHTETAIVRARKTSLLFPNTQRIKTDFIPLKDKSVDIIFLLLAVHEIRSGREKIQFLKECNRICKSNGKVIMIEHLRDLPNFIAFTIGFTHFFSKKVWKKSFGKAGFSSIAEIKFTSFMSIFTCSP
jgi:SAM-dependent methyltransferase